MRAWGLCGLSSSCFVSHMCRRNFGIGIRLERLQMMRSRKVEPYTEAMERGVMKTNQSFQIVTMFLPPSYLFLLWVGGW